MTLSPWHQNRARPRGAGWSETRNLRSQSAFHTGPDQGHVCMCPKVTCVHIPGLARVSWKEGRKEGGPWCCRWGHVNEPRALSFGNQERPHGLQRTLSAPKEGLGLGGPTYRDSPDLVRVEMSPHWSPGRALSRRLSQWEGPPARPLLAHPPQGGVQGVTGQEVWSLGSPDGNSSPSPSDGSVV